MDMRHLCESMEAYPARPTAPRRLGQALGTLDGGCGAPPVGNGGIALGTRGLSAGDVLGDALR
eukprot:CAMPEP_0115842684 /NCGR_PEP_ID=MMETSP0287-20121206/7926_1 /TAXON_ID=412157 /ORGANISM="Chrysochromulina rotalis, Strain UIO044" /LENGTH=62 /DNA_ID=CAMNT_0003296359 /DNA_START=276 /DNA_END=464 /DNA_ORIENTATION=+